MRIETKRRVWMFYRVPWRWMPEVYDQRELTWSACWGCLALEWVSKEWLEYCERKGSGLGTVMEWIQTEVSAPPSTPGDSMSEPDVRTNSQKCQVCAIWCCPRQTATGPRCPRCNSQLPVIWTKVGGPITLTGNSSEVNDG